MAEAAEHVDLLAQSRIQGWHTSVSDDQTKSVASRLCLECMETLKALVKPLAARRDLPRSVLRSYKRSCNAFFLWIDGYNIHIGGLDQPLDASWVLRKLAYQLLASVCDLVTEQLVPALDLHDAFSAQVSSLRAVSGEAKAIVGEGQREYADDDSDDSDGDSDAASDTPSTSPRRGLEEISKDLTNDVQCLLDLSPLIELPTPATRGKGKSVVRDLEAAALIHWSPYQVYGDRISRRFPKAHHSLVERLGKANLARFQRMQEQRRKAATAEEQGLLGGATADDLASRSQFDSGLGPSIATRSSYAETVMHYGQDGGHVVRIPRLPDRAKAGQPFDCLACGRVLSIRSNKVWKKHLYQDLRPWVCLDPACDQGGEPFTSREVWVQHLAINHVLEGQWTTHDCLLCGEPTGDGKMAIVQHLATHVEEVSLAALPAGEDSDGGFEDESDEDDHREVGADSEGAPQSVAVGISELSTLTKDTPASHLPTTQTQAPNTSAIDDTAKQIAGAAANPSHDNPDPVIKTLAENASKNPQLSGLLKRVADGDAKEHDFAVFRHTVGRIAHEHGFRGDFHQQLLPDLSQKTQQSQFKIPVERNLANIDQLILQSTDAKEVKELRQQKRLLRNRQAALDARQRKRQHIARLENENQNLRMLLKTRAEDNEAAVKASIPQGAREPQRVTEDDKGLAGNAPGESSEAFPSNHDLYDPFDLENIMWDMSPKGDETIDGIGFPETRPFLP